MTMVRLKFQRRRGAVLLNVLVILVVISILLAGMAQLMVSDYSIGKVESDYSNSLVVAESGVNYELRKISNSGASADQKNASGAPGTSYTTTAGAVQVYVTQRNADGTEPTPWTPGKNLWIYSKGGVNSLTRSVKVAAVAYTNTPTTSYAVFGVTEGLMNTSPTIVNGDVGTNGFFNFNGHPSISGSVIFNGGSSNWQSPPNGTYSVVHNPNALIWPTVEALAVTAFGSTGLNYVASNNDNLLASPPITSPNLTANSNQTFVGKAGGANYYLTNMTLNGSSQLIFNNSAGPITIWIGPSGGNANIVISGGAATVKMTVDPTKPVKIYSATNGDMAINGSTELDAGIYNINNASSGRIIFNGNPSIYGCLFGNKFTFNNTPTIHAVQGYFSPTGGSTYYGITPPWQEVGGIN